MESLETFKNPFEKMTAIELLEYFIDCPFIIDDATIPRAGIDSAPWQVVLNPSVPWLWLKRAREVVKNTNDSRT